MKVISSLARVLQKIVGIGFFFIWFEIGFFDFATNKANCDWLTLILNMANFSQNKTINTLIVSTLRSQQVQVELLEDCINISYGIFDNIFKVKILRFQGSFHDSWENEVSFVKIQTTVLDFSYALFVKIGARVLDLLLDTSYGPKWPKCSFYAPGPKVNIFLRVHSFAKIGARVLDLWLDTTSGPKCPKCSF